MLRRELSHQIYSKRRVVFLLRAASRVCRYSATKSGLKSRSAPRYPKTYRGRLVRGPARLRFYFGTLFVTAERSTMTDATGNLEILSARAWTSANVTGGAVFFGSAVLYVVTSSQRSAASVSVHFALKMAWASRNSALVTLAERV